MNRSVDYEVSSMSGAAALPRKNGELVFETPWQARIFGMVVAMYKQGLYPWDEFRDRLIAEIAEHSSEAPPADPGSIYYQQWLTSFEELLIDRGILSPEQIEHRAAEFVSGAREDVY